MRRPGPLLWLRYAFTGSLPAQYSAWVLHDLTTGTWLVRHVLRVLVMLMLPEAALVLVLPATGTLRALTAFVTGACVLLLMSILAQDTTERMAQRAGYPWGTAQRLRGQRSENAQRDQAAAFRAKAARRQQRQ